MQRIAENTNAAGIPESEAIRLAQGGNPQAFEQLYGLHCRRVYSLCLRMAGDPTDAEDFTQEAFLQMFRKVHTFRGESSFSTWLHRLTVNVVLMRIRKKRHLEKSLDAMFEPEEESKVPVEFGAPDLRLSGMLDHLNLDRAIDRLPEGYKEMFILHDVQGYEHKEIAAILGCSIGNSKSQLFKARLRLRESLQEELRSQAREEREALRTPPPPPPAAKTLPGKAPVAKGLAIRTHSAKSLGYAPAKAALYLKPAAAKAAAVAAR